MALRLPNIPTTRVENLCATGTEALRGAVYAVAAGACDIALAVGVEKLKDTGYAGLPERTKGTFEDLYLPASTAPGAFAQLAVAYAAKHGFDVAELRRAMAHVSWKSHENGARNPKRICAIESPNSRYSMRRWWHSRSACSTAAA